MLLVKLLQWIFDPIYIQLLIGFESSSKFFIRNRNLGFDLHFWQTYRVRNRDKDDNKSHQNAYTKNTIGTGNAYISVVSIVLNYQRDGKKTLQFASDLTRNSRNLRERRQLKMLLDGRKNGRTDNSKKKSTKTRFHTKVLHFWFFRYSAKTTNSHSVQVSFSIREPMSMSAIMSTEPLGPFGQPALVNVLRQAVGGFRSSDMAKSKSKPKHLHYGINRQWSLKMSLLFLHFLQALCCSRSLLLGVSTGLFEKINWYSEAKSSVS